MNDEAAGTGKAEADRVVEKLIDDFSGSAPSQPPAAAAGEGPPRELLDALGYGNPVEMFIEGAITMAPGAGAITMAPRAGARPATPAASTPTPQPPAVAPEPEVPAVDAAATGSPATVSAATTGSPADSTMLDDLRAFDRLVRLDHDQPEAGHAGDPDTVRYLRDAGPDGISEMTASHALGGGLRGAAAFGAVVLLVLMLALAGAVMLPRSNAPAANAQGGQAQQGAAGQDIAQPGDAGQEADDQVAVQPGDTGQDANGQGAAQSADAGQGAAQPVGPETRAPLQGRFDVASIATAISTTEGAATFEDMVAGNRILLTLAEPDAKPPAVTGEFTFTLAFGGEMLYAIHSGVGEKALGVSAPPMPPEWRDCVITTTLTGKLTGSQSGTASLSLKGTATVTTVGAISGCEDTGANLRAGEPVKMTRVPWSASGDDAAMHGKITFPKTEDGSMGTWTFDVRTQ